MMNVRKTASGALLGAAVGSLVPGVGTLIGGLIGGWFGRRADADDEAAEDQLRQTAMALVPFVSAARARGRISAARRRRMGAAVEACFPGMDAAVRTAILGAVEKMDTDAPAAGAFVGALGDPQAAMLYALRLLSVLYAERPLTRRDMEWISQVASSSGLPPEFWEMAMGHFERAGPVLVPEDRQRWLDELGLPYDAGIDAIKAAWRAAVSSYHPDRLASVPEAVRKLAEEKVKAVNEAYENLCTSPEPAVREFDGLFAVDASGTVAEVDVLSDRHVVMCVVCGQKNRLPGRANWRDSRCGACSALLLLPDILRPAKPAGRPGPGRRARRKGRRA